MSDILNIFCLVNCILASYSLKALHFEDYLCVHSDKSCQSMWSIRMQHHYYRSRWSITDRDVLDLFPWNDDIFMLINQCGNFITAIITTRSLTLIYTTWSNGDRTKNPILKSSDVVLIGSVTSRTICRSLVSNRITWTGSMHWCDHRSPLQVIHWTLQVGQIYCNFTGLQHRSS